MRSLIAGVDDDGRSCILTEIVIEERDIHIEGPSFRTDVFKLRETPPPQRPPGKASYHETGVAPGHADFLVLQMPANIQHPTSSIQCITPTHSTSTPSWLAISTCSSSA
jgi:hypothetical protein